MVSADPVSEYQEAVRRFEAAERKAEQIAHEIVKAGRTLDRDGWKRTTVSNDPTPGGFPAEITLVHGNSINAQNWPNIETLSLAFKHYHKTMHELRNAFSRIPEDTKSVIKGPDFD